MITDEENRTDFGRFMVALCFAVSKADTCFKKINKMSSLFRNAIYQTVYYHLSSYTQFIY